MPSLDFECSPKSKSGEQLNTPGGDFVAEEPLQYTIVKKHLDTFIEDHISAKDFNMTGTDWVKFRGPVVTTAQRSLDIHSKNNLKKKLLDWFDDKNLGPEFLLFAKTHPKYLEKEMWRQWQEYQKTKKEGMSIPADRKILMDVSHQGKYNYIYDEGKDQLHLTVDPFKAFSKDELAEMPRIPVEFTFQPLRQGDRAWEHEIEGLHYFNLYSPPLWQKEYYPPEQYKKPELFIEFIDQLFPDDKSKNLTLRWMYRALWGRNQTALILFGVKGTGKSILSQIMKAFTRPEYANNAPDSVFSSNFNSILGKSRILVAEEAIVRGAGHNKLKNWLNGEANIERKGIDADRTTRIYPNIVITSNNLHDMYLESDDRRFSVPEIRMERMDLKNWPPEKIERLISLCKHDSPFMAHVAHFLHENYRNAEDFEQIRDTKPFNDIVTASLSEWRRGIVEAAEKCEEDRLDLTKMKRDFKEDRIENWPRTWTPVESFIASFVYKNTCLLGSIEDKGKQKFLVFSEEFKKINNIESNTQDNEEEIEDFLTDEEPDLEDL